jgi:flagellar M-ring protein FliF
VASSVDGLEPANVTVVDVDGSVLSAGGAADSQFAGLTNTQQEFQRTLEEDLEKRVQTLLERVVGKGKAIVRVAASLDFKQQEKTEELFDPDSAVVRSEQRAEEKSQGNTPLAMGTPGVTSNVPGASGVESTPNVSSSDMKKTNETINYEINKVVKRTVEPSGVITRLSVAVVIDGTYEVRKDDDGKEVSTYVSRNEDEMKTYQSIVMKAVGYNQARGDQIEVSNVPFETVKLTDQAKKAMERENLWITMRKALPTLMMLLFIGVLVVVVLRPLMKWLTKPLEEVPMITGATGGELLGELGAGTVAGQLMEGSSGKEQVTQLARTDSRRFADLLKNWISQR